MSGSLSRRNFLRLSAASYISLLTGDCLPGQKEEESHGRRPMSRAAKEKQIDVPASLDLVERAELGLNGLLARLDPEVDYELFGVNLYSWPPYMSHGSTSWSGMMPKYLEAVALLRCMSGSDHLRDIEQGLLQATLKNVEEDGLIYDCADPRRPWNVGAGYGSLEWNEDYSCLAGDGRLVCGMDFYYQLTGDEIWKRQMKRTAERMLELAIIKDDYAYHPDPGLGNDFSWPRKSGWVKKDEPAGPKEGQEGAVTFYQAQPIRGWVRWYKHSGDERMLDISRRFTRFVMKPKFWGESDEPENERLRGHWESHIHAELGALRGILEYALVANDYRALEFVRDAWEWRRQGGRYSYCPQLGCHSGTEGCVVGDIPALAIQLSDAGMGDFWDDADAVARNSLAEVQYRDADSMRALGELAKGKNLFPESPLPGQISTERVVERALGAISTSIAGGYMIGPSSWGCCNANANQAFYYIWEAVVRYGGGVATINLFFNRFSPWLDVISYLPFEGKVVLKNKMARRINVRIPAWIMPADLRCTVNGKSASPVWQGRYAQFDGLKGTETLILDFPLRKESLYFAGLRLNAEFKGTTCLSTVPAGESFPASPHPKIVLRPGQEEPGIRIFDRPEYQADKAPMRQVRYYSPDKLIRWY